MLDVLVNGGNSRVGVVGDFQPIEAHDRVVFWHFIAQFFQPLDRANGQHIAHAEERRGAVRAVGSEVFLHTVAGFLPPEVGVDDVVAGQLQTIALHSLVRTHKALHTDHSQLAAMYHHDLAVSLVDEVLGQLVKRFDVVHHHTADIRTGNLNINGHAGVFAFRQQFAVRVVGSQTHQNRAGDVVLIAELFKTFFGLDLGVDNLNGHFHIVVDCVVEAAFHQQCIKIVDKLFFQKAGKHQRDIVIVLGGKVARHLVGAIPQPLRGLHDALPCGRADIWVVVECAGNRTDRDSGFPCNVADRNCHACSLLTLFSTKTVFGTVYTAVFQKRFCCDFFIL